VGANLDGEGPGVLRKVPQESLDELKAIFDVTGATARMEAVEEASRRKAEEMGLTMEQYCEKIYNETSDKHFNC
jgi:heterodisulfide reductase subunit C